MTLFPRRSRADQCWRTGGLRWTDLRAPCGRHHLSRGLRAKAKAEKEQDAAKKAKVYDKARQELLKSVGLESYDALLALGQVYLALEQARSAFDACSQALHSNSSLSPLKLRITSKV